MPLLILLLLVLAAVVVVRQIQSGRERASDPIVVPAPNRPAPPRHQRFSDEEVDRRAAALREAVAAGTIGRDEAIDSLARTCGLDRDDAARRVA